MYVVVYQFKSVYIKIRVLGITTTQTKSQPLYPTHSKSSKDCSAEEINAFIVSGPEYLFYANIVPNKRRKVKV